MIVFCLEEVLRESGLTKKDLLDAKMNRVTVKGLLSGQNTRIDHHVLNELCKILGCQPGDLYKYVPDTPGE